MRAELTTEVLVRGSADGPGTWAMPEEIQRWNEVAPRYGLSVVGPPIPADA